MAEQIIPKWSERLKRFDVDRFDLSVGAETLASWLSDDVGSRSAVQAFLAKFEGLASDSSGGYLGTGNTCHVRAANGFVFIENQFVDEQKVLIGVDHAVALLKDYGRFLDEAKRGREHPPAPLRVDYEKAGSPALEFYLSTGFPLGLV